MPLARRLRSTHRTPSEGAHEGTSARTERVNDFETPGVKRLVVIRVVIWAGFRVLCNVCSTRIDLYGSKSGDGAWAALRTRPPGKVGFNVVGEISSYQDITPVLFRKADCLLELWKLALAQFKYSEANAFQPCSPVAVKFCR